MYLLATQPATARFLLARHGQTNFNAEGRMQGTLDTSVLTLEGISQVAGLGHWMATHEAARVDHAWCSPMTRARQSYAAVAGVCAAAGCALPDETIRKDLREIELHVWEGRLKTEIARDDANGWALWRRAPEEYAFPESGRAPLLDLWARAEGNWAALRRDAAPGSTTFVLSHGALGRTLLGTALGLPAWAAGVEAAVEAHEEALLRSADAQTGLSALGQGPPSSQNTASPKASPAFNED